MLKKTLELAWKLIARPSKAFEDFEREDAALAESLGIYAVFVLLYAAFYAYKPVDFPQMMEDSGLEPHGFGFWLKASFLGTGLYAAWFLALGAFLNLAREGFLFLKIVLQLAWVLASGLALLAFSKGWIGGPAFAAALAALTAPGVWLAWRKPLPWKKLLSLLLAVNLFAALSFGPLAVAAHFRQETLYMVSEFAFLLWMMAVTTRGLRVLSDISLPRCFLSLCLSFLITIIFLGGLYKAGFISAELLKASMAI